MGARVNFGAKTPQRSRRRSRRGGGAGEPCLQKNQFMNENDGYALCFGILHSGHELQHILLCRTFSSVDDDDDDDDDECK